MAIAALARHLLVLAYHLLAEEAPYRLVDANKYEDKLQALGDFRTDTDELEMLCSFLEQPLQY